MTQTLQLPTARVFLPLLDPARYKGVWGGRGSGKSHFFAGLLVERCLLTPGIRAVCIREVQKSLEHSVKSLIEAKIREHSLQGFDVQKAQIKTPGGGVIIFQGMQDHTAESIKSLEGFDIAWVEEAQSLSERSLTLLRPTIREAGSELWFSWNPRFETDPIDMFLRGDGSPRDAVVVRANWSDNPWLPGELRDEMVIDKSDPDRFAHVWEGDYAKTITGAYFAEGLSAAEKDGRIGAVARDPMLPVRAVWDLGIADSMSIWLVQWVRREIRWLDYIEGQGQPLSYYASELRARDWGDVECLLPHDGAKRDTVMAVRFDDHLREAGFRVRTIPNQGKGAAVKRIEVARRLFPQMWFDDKATKAGRTALAAYHEKRDEVRNIGLGPEHDWASHAADAFGLGCVAYEEPAHGRSPVKFIPRHVI